MADLTWAEVLAIDGGLSVLDPAAHAMIVATADESVNPDVFGGVTAGRYQLARATFAAHLGRMALDAAGNGGGPVASRTVGGLSKSYFQAAAASSELGETKAGRAFRALARTSAARAGLVI